MNNQLFLTGTAMALPRQAQLKNLINLLEQEKIETVILKGAWTAEILYPHPALRTMHDIDILLMPNDEIPAYKIIKKNGYVPYAGEYDGPKHLPSLVPLNNRGLAVELHHDISSRSDRFTAERLWEYSEPCKIAGIEARVFIPEMLFLHHCLHMVEEYFGNGIKNVTETAFMIDKKLFDAGKLFKLADELELSATLALSLAVVEQLFGISIPFMPEKLPQVPHAILINACHLICNNNSKLDKTSAMLSRECCNRDFFSKIGFLLKRAFRPPAQIAGMYDCSKYSPKLPFYYLHRIFKYAVSVPEAWLSGQQTGKNSTAHEIGQYQRKIIDFCKIDNYHG
ncbi:MAG: nucleotidyltransferase family protein [Victivallaceae bacterium]|nr:nucleotidyltransferase family protein [Victivallaceae bacterium]